MFRHVRSSAVVLLPFVSALGTVAVAGAGGSQGPPAAEAVGAAARH